MSTTATGFEAPETPPRATSDGLDTQARVTAEIRALQTGRDVPSTAQHQPLLDFAPYRSTLLRHPTKDLHHADPETIELVSPVFGDLDVSPLEADLTLQHTGEPIGERITIRGRVVDGGGHPVRRRRVEVWQANAAGRYVHKRDRHPAPLDPNFTGLGRCLTDDDGHYAFTTISPARTPGATTATPGAPRTSTSRSSGRSSPSGWWPRCTFPGIPSSRWTRSTRRSPTRPSVTSSWRPTTTTPRSMSGRSAIGGTSSSVVEAVLNAVAVDQIARLSLTVASAGGTIRCLPAEDMAELSDLGTGLNRAMAWRHELARLPSAPDL